MAKTRVSDPGTHLKGRNAAQYGPVLRTWLLTGPTARLSSASTCHRRWQEGRVVEGMKNAYLQNHFLETLHETSSLLNGADEISVTNQADSFSFNRYAWGIEH